MRKCLKICDNCKNHCSNPRVPQLSRSESWDAFEVFWTCHAYLIENASKAYCSLLRHQLYRMRKHR